MPIAHKIDPLPQFHRGGGQPQPPPNRLSPHPAGSSSPLAGSSRRRADGPPASPASLRTLTAATTPGRLSSATTWAVCLLASAAVVRAWWAVRRWARQSAARLNSSPESSPECSWPLAAIGPEFSDLQEAEKTAFRNSVERRRLSFQSAELISRLESEAFRQAFMAYTATFIFATLTG
eukprot:EG_transcript_28114